MPEPIVTPPVTGEVPVATPPVEGTPEETYTVKVNGEERKLTRAQLIERAQKGEGAEAAMKQAAEVNKAFATFVANAQDPTKLLELLQHPSLKYDEEKQEMLATRLLASKNPRVLNAVKKWIYDNEIAPAMMDPRERELAELKAERAARQKQDEEREAAQKETEKQLAVQKAWTDYRAKIGESMKAEGVPPTESTVGRVARYALLQRQAKKPVDILDCVKRVKADLIREHDERFSSADDDKILDLLPEKLAERIHKAWLNRLKGGAGNAAVEPKKTEKEEPLSEMLKRVNRGGHVEKA